MMIMGTVPMWRGLLPEMGLTSDGKYKGIAPEARLVGIKVLNQEGTGTISNVISGIEWCLDHQSTLNTRIINLSFQDDHSRITETRSFMSCRCDRLEKRSDCL